MNAKDAIAMTVKEQTFAVMELSDASVSLVVGVISAHMGVKRQNANNVVGLLFVSMVAKKTIANNVMVNTYVSMDVEKTIAENVMVDTSVSMDVKKENVRNVVVQKMFHLMIGIPLLQMSQFVIFWDCFLIMTINLLVPLMKIGVCFLIAIPFLLLSQFQNRMLMEITFHHFFEYKN